MPSHRVLGELEQVQGSADEEERVAALFGSNPPETRDVKGGRGKGQTSQREGNGGYNAVRGGGVCDR